MTNQKLNISLTNVQAVHLLQFIRFQRAFTEKDICQSLDEIHDLIAESAREGRNSSRN